MQEMERDIMAIERPRTLMDAAKAVVKSSEINLKYMSPEALQTLIDEEAECEYARLNAHIQYSPSRHVTLLAKLINQARQLSIKGRVC